MSFSLRRRRLNLRAGRVLAALLVVILSGWSMPAYTAGDGTSSAPAAGAVFVVTNNFDLGAGSLRQAITDANATPGTDTINFSISSGLQTIEVGRAEGLPLPVVTDPVVIDATTQPGFNGKPLIELTGTRIETENGDGFRIAAGSSVLKGLVINRFPLVGIRLVGRGGNIIQNCYVGTDATATRPASNVSEGIRLEQSSGNLIGGMEAGTGNVVSGNPIDVVLMAGSHHNQVSGNFIGTDGSGNLPIGNQFQAFSIISASHNIIGGAAPGARNVIMGGLTIAGDRLWGAASGNQVKGNYIGLNAAGTVALSQGDGNGVFIYDRVTDNVIGGTTPAERNIISGNGGHGIEIRGSLAEGNRVLGNYIGTDPTGTFAIKNLGSGVLIDGVGNTLGEAGAGNLISGHNYTAVVVGGRQNVVRGNLIGTRADGVSPLGNGGVGVSFGLHAQGNIAGGTESGEGNIIAFNNLFGVLDQSTDSMTPPIRGNAIRGNSIHSNGALGINVGDVHRIEPNDAGDADRNTQNFPVINSAVRSGSAVTIKGTLSSAPTAAFALEFFSSPACDASGYGEGQTLIGVGSVLTNASGNAEFTFTFPAAVAAGHAITATATNANNETSEFSQCLIVRAAEDSACLYSLSSSQRTSPVDGETFTVAVVAQAGCYWTAVSNSDFIGVSSGAISSGTNLVTLAVAANGSGAPRTGTVTIAGQVFTVTQPQLIHGAPTIYFSDPFPMVREHVGAATLTVVRGGDTSRTASVNYHTVDNDKFTDGCGANGLGAFGRCDYSTTFGQLDFAAGEAQKTFTIPIIDDGYAEHTEPFKVVLSNPSGVTLGAWSTAQVGILDNDSLESVNPVFNTPFFVRQHYLDFLSREPEANEPWSGVLNRCPDVNRDASCDRATVSQSFFGSPEFQLKGSYAFRFYKVAFNRLPEYPEIVSDMSFVAGATEAEVYARKAQLATQLTERLEFQAAYARVSNHAFVAALLGRYALTRITTPDPAKPDGTEKVTLTQDEMVSKLDTGALTRAQALRAVADSDEVSQAEFNNTFVAMQYYGYLRRKPDEAGYQAWLRVINQDSQNVRIMVDGFMNSVEFKLRFGRVQ